MGWGTGMLEKARNEAIAQAYSEFITGEEEKMEVSTLEQYRSTLDVLVYTTQELALALKIPIADAYYVVITALWKAIEPFVAEENG